MKVVGKSQIEVDQISASVSVSALNVDKWALSAHIRFRRAAVGKFGGRRKYGTELELRRQRMRQTQESLDSLCTD